MKVSFSNVSSSKCTKTILSSFFFKSTFFLKTPNFPNIKSFISSTSPNYQIEQKTSESLIFLTTYYLHQIFLCLNEHYFSTFDADRNRIYSETTYNDFCVEDFALLFLSNTFISLWENFQPWEIQIKITIIIVCSLYHYILPNVCIHMPFQVPITIL